MTNKKTLLARMLPLAVLPLSILAGCGYGPKGAESNAQPRERAPLLGSTLSEPEIVHVDDSKRIVTFRTNGKRITGEFLVSTDRSGEQSGILKLIDVPVSSPLRTADILEGSPSINDIISKADPALSQKLREIYRDAEVETE